MSERDKEWWDVSPPPPELEGQLSIEDVVIVGDRPYSVTIHPDAEAELMRLLPEGTSREEFMGHVMEALAADIKAHPERFTPSKETP